MDRDSKRAVVQGYDAMAHEYLERLGVSSVRDRWLDVLIAALPTASGASVLDLGCGAGIPVAHRLAGLGHEVLGIDGSLRQVELARTHVPNARFLRADMTCVDLDADAFDAVVAFYSISHVPATEHGAQLVRIAGWLEPGGAFLGSFGTGPSGDWRGCWLGTDMFFSHHDEPTTRALITTAGLRLERVETVAQDNEDATFLWILARKPVMP